MENGFITTTFPEKYVTDGADLEVTAVIVEPSGNKGKEGEDSALVDLTPPSAPTVTIHDGDDGKLSIDELKGIVLATIQPPENAQIGDIIVVKTNGTEIFNTTLTKGFIEHGFTLPVDNSLIPQEGELVVTAQITDKAQNQSEEGKDTSIIDQTPPNDGNAPEVVILTDSGTEVNGALTGKNDGYINRAEYENSGENVKVRISFDGDKVEIGDKINFNANIDGKKTPQTFIIDQNAKDNGYVDLEVGKLDDKQNLEATATITDDFGNETKEGKDSAIADYSNFKDKLDVELTQDILDSNGNAVQGGDGIINIDELNGADKVLYKITLPKDAHVGDQLTITVNNDTHNYKLQAQDVKNGYVEESTPVPASGTQVEVKAYLTDTAQNVSNEATDSAVIRLDAPDTPTVVITEDIDKNGWINKAELNGDVDYVITLPTPAKNGDKLVVSIDVNGTIATEEVTLTDGQSVVNLSKSGLVHDDTITVKAHVVDGSGNVGKDGEATAKLDLTEFKSFSDEDVVIKDDINNDGFLNKVEMDDGSGGLKTTITVEVTIPKGASDGDQIKVALNGVEKIVKVGENGIPTEAGEKFEVVFDSTAPSDGTTYKATATISDSAGNSADLNPDEATVQVVAPNKPIVTITEDVNNDGVLNIEEYKQVESDGFVNVDVEVPSSALSGEKINVYVNGEKTPFATITLSENGTQTLHVEVPKDKITNDALSVEASLVSKGGNESDKGSDSVTIDTNAPTIEIKEPITPDGNNIINAEESKDVDISGETKGVENGQEVTLVIKDESGNEIVKTATVTDNKWGVSDMDVSTLEQGDVTIKATVSDKAGNSAKDEVDGAKIEYKVEIDSDSTSVTVDEDGLISDKESENAHNTISGKNLGDNPTFVISADKADSGLTSNGVKVLWDKVGEFTTKMVGKAGDEEILKVTMGEDGKYDVNLLKPIDHPDATSEDTVATKLNLKVTNTDSGNEVDTILTVNVNDDIPEVAAEGTEHNIDLSSSDTNLVLTLDLSVSMNLSAEIEGSSLTRLDVMKDSVKRLIEGYEKYGDVKVNIVTFSTTAQQGTGWLKASDAKALMDTLVADGYRTNYEAALYEAMQAFKADGKIESGNVQNVQYFLSDGSPNISDGNVNTISNPDVAVSGPDFYINEAETKIWQDFLSEAGVKSVSLGMGNVYSTFSLDPIATGKTAIIVTKMEQLDTELQKTITIDAKEGDLLKDSFFGADGEGSFAVTINGVTYTYDAKENHITNSANSDVVDGKSLEVSIKTNSTITLDMTTGKYSFKASLEDSSSDKVITEEIAYTLTDKDGDTASSTAILKITPQGTIDVPTPTPKPSLSIKVASDDDVIDTNEAKELTVSGKVENMPKDGVISVVITDSQKEDHAYEVKSINDKGEWSAKLNISDLPTGAVSIKAAMKANGSEVVTSNAALLTIATLITQTVTIDTPISNDDIVSNEEESSVSISGTSENIPQSVGATVQVIVSDDNDATEDITGMAQITSDGHWRVDGLDLSTLDAGELNVSALVLQEHTTPGQEDVVAKSVKITHEADVNPEPVDPNHKVGTDGDDVFEYDGTQSVDGKGGTDILHITTIDKIDFSAIDDLDTKIESIEGITLDSETSIDINPDDILSMSDDKDVIFKIDGGTANLSNSDGSQWTKVEDPLSDGYTRYEGLSSEGYTIKVDIADTIIVDM